MDKDVLIFEGSVLEVYPDMRCLVKINEKLTVAAYPGGKLKKYSIKIMPGDRVVLEISPYDLKTGRIIKRL